MRGLIWSGLEGGSIALERQAQACSAVPHSGGIQAWPDSDIVKQEHTAGPEEVNGLFNA